MCKASGDAITTDTNEASTPLVTINVLDTAKNPLAGAPVLFSDANGATLGTTTTDANGIASWALPSGGQITVSFSGDLTPRLFTVTGVEPLAPALWGVG